MPAVSSQQVDLPPRYRVVRHIANGGMATVWAAEDSVLERLVAVKVLAPGYAVDPAARRRFTREARAAARVSDHPNVVTIFDIGETSTSPAFIVMEHFAGGSVADRLRARDQRPVPPALALRWLRETASALDAAHAADIVHRDVKPGNLLLDENGRLAVGDFGIASLAGETAVTAAGQVLGTAAYLSPEQARGHAATPASDRYSLAVVAYELLCGRRPFDGDTPMAQARARVEGDPITLTGECDAAAGALRWGLSRAPEDRPRSAAAFVDELERSLGAAGGSSADTAVVPGARRRTGPEWSGDGRPRFARDEAGAARDPWGRRPDDEVFPGAGGAGRREPVAAVAEAEPPERERPRDPVARSRNPHRKAFMLAALAAGCVVVGAGAALISDDGNNGGRDTTAPRATASKSQGSPTGGGTVQRASAGAGAAQQPQAQAPAPPASSTAPAGTTNDDRSPAQLNNAGFAMLPSNATGALPLLQKAVDTFRAQGATSSTDYAYSLYNLGWALRLAGRPADAIPYLQERLRISNYKRDIVQNELATAQAAAGQPVDGGPGNAKAKHGKGPAKHDKKNAAGGFQG
ncbi:MAG TPA: serine/threonine-protein kinase [Baekduia sp.]